LPTNSYRNIAPAFLVPCIALLLATVLCSVRAAAQADTVPADIVGAWKGNLGNDNAVLHLTLSVVKKGSGEYAAMFDSVDQGSQIPASGVTFSGNRFHMEVKAIGGVYEGTLSDDHNSLKGTWTQEGSPSRPLVMQRDTAAQSGHAATPDGPKEKPFIVPLDVSVPVAPRAFQANQKMQLVYELHAVNMGKWEVEMRKIEVFSADASGRSLATLSGSALDGDIAHPGVSVTDAAKIPGGTEAVIYVWITLDKPGDVPAALVHRFTVKVGTYPEELSVDMKPSVVSSNATARIQSPLHGDHWLAGNGPSNTSGHRRALIPIDARAAIAQRFAIDWVRLGDDGATFRGDKLDNKNYYAFGVEAYAVADGVVTETKDGIPQNIPGEHSRAVPITLETVGGNHVIIDIGGGNFAFYAHLQPGSLRVKLGDRVRTGQVIGLVGNTGNSTEPHLHFHISNASSPLGSEGLPYTLPSFEVQGSGWKWKPSDGVAPVQRTNEIPLENDVVRFSEK